MKKKKKKKKSLSALKKSSRSISHTPASSNWTFHFQLENQTSGDNSELAMNSSAVVDWRGWSCVAGVVFSPPHIHVNCQPSDPRRDASCAGHFCTGNRAEWTTTEPNRSRARLHISSRGRKKQQPSTFATEQKARGDASRGYSERNARALNDWYLDKQLINS